MYSGLVVTLAVRRVGLGYVQRGLCRGKMSVRLKKCRIKTVPILGVGMPSGGWRFSLVVTRWSRSTKLFYVGPG